MAGPIEVTGAAQLANLSRSLKAAGRGELRRELLRGIRQATAPAKTAIPESARVTLPRRGGLNETVASGLKVTSRASLSGAEARVRIVAVDPPRHDIHSMNLGRLRHPVYGNRDNWVTQAVPPLFFTNACMSLAPGARQQVAAARDRVLRALTT